MKVNFDQPILGLDGKTAIKVGTSEDSPAVTIGFVCAMALMQEEKDALDKKLRAFKLLQKITSAEGKNEEIELDSEQVALLKEKVGAPGFQNLVIVGRVMEALTD